mmetsp:Transcript_14315/g.42234  ORF Transcript_14315/g.42234 Transcript_14315/m.42234 type:complete len:253 (-) Transcript_14315:1292-2050(-)
MQRCRALCAAGTGAKGVIRIPAHRPIREPNCYQLVLLRHGESEWNFAKRFTGWVDVDLTETGRLQAARAGKVLKNHNFEFDEAHASVLKRAVRTLWTALHSSDHHWIPVRHTWRLNERHYGGLTGLSKKEAERELGKDMLLRYRRGYDTEPLPMEETHPYWTGSDRRYRDLGTLLPTGESLQQCKEVRRASLHLWSPRCAGLLCSSPCPPFCDKPHSASCRTGTSPSCLPFELVVASWLRRTTTSFAASPSI